MPDTDHRQHVVIQQKNLKKKILLKIKLKKSKFKHSALDTAGKLFLYLATTKKCVLLNDGTGC